MNNVYSGPLHARDHGTGRSVASIRNWPQGVHEGLIECPYQDDTKKKEASAPLSHLEALKSLHNISNTTARTYIDICKFLPTRCKLFLFIIY